MTSRPQAGSALRTLSSTSARWSELGADSPETVTEFLRGSAPGAHPANDRVFSAVVAVGAVPAVLGAAGFTSAGIAASSLAAKMMSAAAIANGGGVAAGSLVATLQSVGKCPGQEGRRRWTGARTGLSPEAEPEGGPVLSLQFRGPQGPWASVSPSRSSFCPVRSEVWGFGTERKGRSPW